MATTITKRISGTAAGGATKRVSQGPNDGLTLLELEGDAGDGVLLLEGDVQSGSDALKLEGDVAAADEAAFASAQTKRIPEPVV
jgi:hypothetical protein